MLYFLNWFSCNHYSLYTENGNLSSFPFDCHSFLISNACVCPSIHTGFIIHYLYNLLFITALTVIYWFLPLPFSSTFFFFIAFCLCCSSSHVLSLYPSAYIYIYIHIYIHPAWFKKMDSISYVYISWTIHGMWMIYITSERGGPKFSNTIARALA